MTVAFMHASGLRCVCLPWRERRGPTPWDQSQSTAPQAAL